MKNTLFLASMALLLSFCIPVQAADPIGLIIGLKGSAAASDAAGVSRVLEDRAKIFLNDTITTGAGAKIQILFSDDTLFSQGENSVMTIDQYIYDPEEKGDAAFGVKLGQGIFRTITGRITAINPDGFHVKTARSTIGIRGCELGFHITGPADRIFIITIPPNKRIFINPFTGNEHMVLGSPATVTVDNEGRMETHPLTAGDHTLVRQHTMLSRVGWQGGGQEGGGGGEQGGGHAQLFPLEKVDPGNPFGGSVPGGDGDIAATQI